jgi:hypothetical protein
VHREFFLSSSQTSLSLSLSLSVSKRATFAYFASASFDFQKKRICDPLFPRVSSRNILKRECLKVRIEFERRIQKKSRFYSCGCGSKSLEVFLPTSWRKKHHQEFFTVCVFRSSLSCLPCIQVALGDPCRKNHVFLGKEQVSSQSNNLTAANRVLKAMNYLEAQSRICDLSKISL